MLIVLAPRPRAKDKVVNPYSCGNGHNDKFKLSRKLKSLLIKQQDEADSYKQKTEVKKQRSVSECYFVVKGAALILPHDDCMNVYRKTSNNGGKSCDIQLHLKSMFYLLREEDTLRMAVKLESMHTGRTRYLVIVSCNGRQESEESCLLGVDCSNKTTIGLVLPVWADTHITLDGDGGFSVSSSGRHHIFKPVSVQAMWSALQTLHKASAKAREYNYFTGGATHQWIDYYEKCIDSDRSCLNEWHAMDDLESRRPPSPDTIRSKPTEREATEKLIRTKLKELMMSVDLDEVTSKFIRTSLEEEVDMNLNEYKSFIDQEMLMILGQMDAPTEIFEYLYLGSEWNASNLDELKANGVDHILNVTREIDNFFPGMFDYLNVRVYDDESTEMLKYWDKTFKYIQQVKSLGSKVLVHCKMGISRSASVVIAYVMKAYDWELDRAVDFVKNKRNCIKPNQGFVKQLEIYQGILDASKQRHNSLWRSKSETNLNSDDRNSSKCSSQLSGEDNQNSFHLSLPGSVSRPKSWSPDDSVSESLFPTCALVFDKPFLPLRQRCSTDPQIVEGFGNHHEYLELINSVKIIENVEETTTLAVNAVPRVSSIKDRINELESQVGSSSSSSSTVTECQRLPKVVDNKQTLASSKSGLVLNLATQFESVSKPSSPEFGSTTMVFPTSKEDLSDMQGVEAVVSQTKPVVTKHQAVLVKPTWSQDNECNTNHDKMSNTVVSSQAIILEPPTADNSILLNVDCDLNSVKENVGGGGGSSSQMDNNQTNNKNKSSHSVKEIHYSRQSSCSSSCLSSPKTVEPILWSRQSSCSSSGVCSSPIHRLAKDHSSNDKNSSSGVISSSPPNNIELLTDIKSIQHKLLGQDELKKEVDPKKNNSTTKTLLYEKEDIPWAPGTVRRTKQQIESNTLKRTTSFDSAFPAQSRSTPSTPPELSLDVESGTSVTRSHSLHNEHRPRSTAFQSSCNWAVGYLHDSRKSKPRHRKEKLPPTGFNRRISHSISTPSVVEAVNQVLCGTHQVLTSAIQSIPSHSLELSATTTASTNISSSLNMSNHQTGIVKQNCDILESLSPRNTQTSNKITPEPVTNQKEFGQSLVNTPADLEEETDCTRYGKVKRLTKELEAKAGSPGYKKERIIIVDKDPDDNLSNSLPSSPLLNSARNDAEKVDSEIILRKSLGRSNTSNRNSTSDSSSMEAQPQQCRKTSLDMDKLKQQWGNSSTEKLDLLNVKKLPVVPSNKLPEAPSLMHNLKASTGRPPPIVRSPFSSIPPPPPPPMPCNIGPAKKARKLQQGKSHPLTKLTVKQRHANPLYNTM